MRNIFRLWMGVTRRRIVGSTLSNSRPNKVGLKCPSVNPYVRSSTNSFFNFNEIWHVGRGWWVMHDGMQYDPIQRQSQGQGHEPFKVGNPAIFKRNLLRHFHWPRILKLWQNIQICSGRIFYICPSFCVTWLRTWQKHQFRRVDRQSRTGLIF